MRQETTISMKKTNTSSGSKSLRLCLRLCVLVRNLPGVRMFESNKLRLGRFKRTPPQVETVTSETSAKILIHEMLSCWRQTQWRKNERLFDAKTLLIHGANLGIVYQWLRVMVSCSPRSDLDQLQEKEMSFICLSTLILFFFSPFYANIGKRWQGVVKHILSTASLFVFFQIQSTQTDQSQKNDFTTYQMFGPTVNVIPPWCLHWVYVTTIHPLINSFLSVILLLSSHPTPWVTSSSPHTTYRFTLTAPDSTWLSVHLHLSLLSDNHWCMGKGDQPKWGTRCSGCGHCVRYSCGESFGTPAAQMETGIGLWGTRNKWSGFSQEWTNVLF